MSDRLLPRFSGLHARTQIERNQSQSIMFLREVADFREAIYAVEVDEDTLFREFIEIVNMYIKSGSSYEVNIDYRARAEVMRDAEEARFKELDTVSNGFELSVSLLFLRSDIH